jgi:hypothetical protein
MGWIYQVPGKPEPHVCDTPRTESEPFWFAADGNPGSVWSCDDCGQLWEVVQGRMSYYPSWLPATRRTRRQLKKQGIWTEKKEELVHDGVSDDRPGSA